MALIDQLLPSLRSCAEFSAVKRVAEQGADVTLMAPGLIRPLLASALFKLRPRPLLCIVPGEEGARRFAHQLAALLGPQSVLRFPESGVAPGGTEAPEWQLAGNRARALHSLMEGRPNIVVTSARALLKRLPSPESRLFDPLVLAAGAPLDLKEVARRLQRMGYTRAEIASERGFFAIRGGILDVFPGDLSHPVRAELYGDEIETLRKYVPSTGQSIGDIEALEIFRCGEVAQIGLAESLTGLTSYLSPEAAVVLVEPASLFIDAAKRYDELSSAAISKTSVEERFISPGELDFGSFPRMTMLSLLAGEGSVDAKFSARRPEALDTQERFVAGMRSLAEKGYTVVLTAPRQRSREKLRAALADAGVTARLSSAELPAGFIMPEARLAVVSIDDIQPRSAATRRNAAEVDPSKVKFAFTPGDYVVHASHGIALFKEVGRKEVLGVEREYLVLVYAKGDRLYVPVEQIDRVSKYVGPQGTMPRITRLNTADWSKATSKARKAARKLAFDLVDLYARRASVTGHAFSADTPWQREMEAAFPYIETPDQLSAIADVKEDMESDSPMDRLICGDVGYGKTEVAIRAAFKAAMDNKQVMILCPTTILAQQHFINFSERFEPFGVRVEVLSRFRTPAQQAVSLEGFAKGEVAVLIGTHRLLSRDVSPRDLGLVIIDEEQRFGVEHKEHLKNLREQVDVLAMSATPIPRTLQMSLSSVRDMSVIDTPPANRHPVQVCVCEWNEATVSEAVCRELERGGQVYYVSNRIGGIDDAVRRVLAVAPEARIGVAHGKMSEKRLEHIMESFSAGEFDILVATTIIESGIDNPHSNTLIIEDSQRLGLSQLYQLKGRVGRSHVRAFAYFMFPKIDALTEQAVERLAAIQESAELGSGIKIAMRDLEIRGAGSLLGGEQSGNFNAVGFDLFVEMLREAVAEARGEPVVAFPEVRIDLPVAAFLPEGYVTEVDERVKLYRRLAGATGLEALEQIERELLERYGDAPEPAQNLVALAKIKILAAQAEVTRVAVVRDRLQLAPVRPGPATRQRLISAGAVLSEKDFTLTKSLKYGGSVVEAAQEILNVILRES